jgi:DNA topoisomerase-2
MILKKTEKKKIRIDGYDAANYAGTKKSNECILILCEGLSAKTYAVTGIEIGWNGKKGRDYFGICPLMGKCLNVRNASTQSLATNKEMTNILQILNLKYNMDYSKNENFQTLHYGRVLFLTDADTDGIHISSLLLNYFDVLFPSLLKRNFVYSMMTPIAKIKNYIFYNEYEYHSYLEKNAYSDKIKYYKGLGTSSNDEVKNTFGKKVVQFVYDENASSTLNKVFHQKYANERKNWLEHYDPKMYQNIDIDYSISTFIDQDLIRFSIDDCKRNIPNLFDGFKLSQRKILYSVLKKKLYHSSKSMKVVQLGGYVAEVSNYHHGETCLFDTIIKMTHSFVGTNNIPLLFPDGQFGSRLHGGKDAANGRYIFTKLYNYTLSLFCENDEPLLSPVYDDNEKVEPEYYIPIIPLILVNGCHTGIGTGWSCSIPPYHPLQIINAIDIWIDQKEKNEVFDITIINDMIPYYHGFKGTIEKINDVKFLSKGILNKTLNKYIITELPIGMWTDKYKEYLEELMDLKKIKQLKNYSTANTIHFEFMTHSSFIPDLQNMKLTSSINITNMVLFHKHFKLQKFHSLSDIFVTYCQERYSFYILRKENMIKKLTLEFLLSKNKLRFIQCIQTKQINLFEENDEHVDLLLENLHFDKIENSYHYLLNMSLRQITKTKIIQLEESIQKIEQNIKELQEMTAGFLWKSDLNHLKKILSF